MGIAVAVLLLSLITGFSQIKTQGLAWQEAHYAPRLAAMIQGTAPAPDQYRLLSDGLAAATVRLAESAGLPRPVGLTFVVLRLAQNLLLFSLAWVYYRRLGIAPYPLLLGLSALAWGMTQANYGADLGFSAFTDVLLYLCAAIALLEGRPRWIIAIAAVAALNRESSVLLPFVALACAVRRTPVLRLERSIAGPALAALSVWVLLYVGLVLIFGARPFLPFVATPGLAMLKYNLSHGEAWGHAVGTLGIVPVLALLSWRGWPPLLKPLFWSVVPLWCIAHLFCAPLDQSRVLLLPQVLVFIPGLLGGLAWWREQRENDVPGLLV